MDRADIMIDTELMGKSSRGAVVAIAACRFARGGPDPTWEDVQRDGFSCAVNLQSCINVGLEVDGGTISWWLDQSNPARRALLKDPVPLREALSAFRKYLLRQCDDNPKNLLVWAKPAAGDLVILEQAYLAIGSRAPWQMKNRRCLSALRQEIPIPRWPSADLPRQLKHVALWDVYDQILDARAALTALARLV